MPPQPATGESVVRLGDEPRQVVLRDLTDRGRTFALGDGTFRIGRDPESDIILDTKGTSRNHARVEVSGASARLVDLGSANGTYLNGKRLQSQAVLETGDEVKISTTVFAVTVRQADRPSNPNTVLYQTEPVGSLRLVIPGEAPYELALHAGEHYVGRRADCDVVVPQPDVSRRHARLLVQENEVLVEDLGSGNGTLVNGRRISAPTRVKWGSTITVGKNRLELRSKGQAQIRADATQLHVAALRRRADAEDEEVATHAVDLPPRELARRLSEPPHDAPPPSTVRRAGFWAGLSAGLAILAVFLCGTVVAVLHQRPPDVPSPPKGSLGKVLVDSEPEGATVVIDARATDRVTPAEIEVTPDTLHVVEVRREGYEPRTWNVNVSRGERSTLRFMMVHSPEPPPPDASTAEHDEHDEHDDELARPPPPGHARATLTLDSSPPTDVYLGGARLGTTPLKSYPVAPGELAIELRNNSLGIHKTLHLRARPGQALTDRVTLQKGKVAFNVKPWAELSADGRELGRSPVTVELYEGSYAVTASNMDLGVERVLHVEVVGGKTTTVSEELK